MEFIEMTALLQFCDYCKDAIIAMTHAQSFRAEQIRF